MVRLVSKVALALALGPVLALVLLAHGGGAGQQAQAVLACGFDSPQTMLADTTPSLRYPVTPQTPGNAPQGIFPLDYSAGKAVTFVEDLSRVPGNPSNAQWRWRWSFGDNTGYSYDVSPEHVYAKPGKYDVRAWIYAPDGGSDPWGEFDSAEIHIIPQVVPNPPVARATASTSITWIGSTGVTFDASGSHSADGSPLTYTWNFNDTTIATGPRATHVFQISNMQGDSKGSFVALIVTDKRGAKSFTKLDMRVFSDGPQAKLQASDAEVDTGTAITFDASQSQPPVFPSGNIIVKYSWNFGDGSPVQTTDMPTVSHSFSKAGSFTVAMTAYDRRNVPDTATVKVTVLGAAVSSGGVSPVAVGGIVALLAALGLGFYFWREQRKRAQLLRRRQRTQQAARAQSSAYGHGRQPTGRQSAPSKGSGAGRSGERRPPRGS